MKPSVRISALLVAATLMAGDSYAARGRADFTRFVALGDSFGAGVSSVGLNQRHQRYSWPAVIARQVGLNTDCTTDAPGCFQIPYISEPGILPELQLTSLSPLGLSLRPGLGAPLNSGLPRAYNNLSVDGAEVADLINGLSGDGNEAINGPLITRGLGTPVDQALSLNPTFIAIWIGGNDAFNGVNAGISRMTSVADFTRDYNALLTRLVAGAPNAGMVVGNLPTDIRRVPYTNVIPSVLVGPDLQPIRDPRGNLIPLIADLGGGNFGPLPAGSLVTLPAQSLIVTGYGIPEALRPLLPNLPNIGRPLPDEVTLTPSEITTVNQRLADFNDVIRTAAAARDIPVVDINALFNRLVTGYRVGPFTFSLAYVTGGVISLDGYHLTDIGYTLFANEYIRTINRAYGTRIPVASIAQFFQTDTPMITLDHALPEISEEAAAAMLEQYSPHQ